MFVLQVYERTRQALQTHSLILRHKELSLIASKLQPPIRLCIVLNLVTSSSAEVGQSGDPVFVVFLRNIRSVTTTDRWLTYVWCTEAHLVQEMHVAVLQPDDYPACNLSDTPEASLMLKLQPSFFDETRTAKVYNKIDSYKMFHNLLG